MNQIVLRWFRVVKHLTLKLVTSIGQTSKLHQHETKKSVARVAIKPLISKVGLIIIMAQLLHSDI